MDVYRVDCFVDFFYKVGLALFDGGRLVFLLSILFGFSIPFHFRAKRSKTFVFEQPSVERFSNSKEYHTGIFLSGGIRP